MDLRKYFCITIIVLFYGCGNSGSPPGPRPTTQTVTQDYSLFEDEIIEINFSKDIILHLGKNVDLDAASLSINNWPDFGELVFDLDNFNLTYTPKANYRGFDLISFSIQSLDGRKNRYVVDYALTITDINDKPVANEDVYSHVHPNTKFKFSLSKNDTDIEDIMLLNTNIEFINTPDDVTITQFEKQFLFEVEKIGTYILNYRIKDSAGEYSSISTATFTVIDNKPPALKDDIIAFKEGDVLVISPMNNDKDDGQLVFDSLQFDNTVEGTLSYNFRSGNMVYRNNNPSLSTITIPYSIKDDDGLEASAVITINIESVNDMPVANDIVISHAHPNIPITIDIKNYVFDEENLLDINSTLIVDAPAEVNAKILNNGIIELTVVSTGKYIINYKVKDDKSYSLPATLTVNVLDIESPVAQNDKYLLLEDTKLSNINLLANDSKSHGDIDPATIVFEGKFALGNITPTEKLGIYEFIPNTNQCGTDSIGYTFDDGEHSIKSNVGTIEMTIKCVNDSPNVGNKTVTINGDGTTHTISVADIIDDVDSELNMSSVRITQIPNSADIAVDTTTGLISIASTVLGMDSLKFTIDDQLNATSNEGTVNIHVSGKNFGSSVTKTTGKTILLQNRERDSTLSTPVTAELMGVQLEPATINTIFNPASLREGLTSMITVDTNLVADLNANIVMITVKPDTGPILGDKTILLLDELYQRDIKAVITVYDDITNLPSIEATVNYLKTHPAIFGWNLGDAGMFSDIANSIDIANKIETAAKLIKSLDSNHVVFASMGDITPLTQYTNIINTILTSIDVFNLHVARTSHFGNFFRQWASISNKPMSVSYGTDSFASNIITEVPSGIENETLAADWLESQYLDLYHNSISTNANNVASGGFVDTLTDQYYHNLPTDVQNTDGVIDKEATFDGVVNTEWSGLVTLDRKPKISFTRLKSLYSGNIPTLRNFDFIAMPNEVVTNLSSYIVTGSFPSNMKLTLNGIAISPVFKVAIPLVSGANEILLEAETPEGVVSSYRKTIIYDSSLDLSNQNLLYVSSTVAPIIGTIIIDLDRNLFMGLIPDHKVQDITRDGKLLFTDTKLVFNTATHTELPSPKSPLAINGASLSFEKMALSLDGNLVYHDTDVVSLQSNSIVDTLPESIIIISGGSHSGGPGINSNFIFYKDNPSTILNLSTNTVCNTGIGPDRSFLSDLSVKDDLLFVSKYNFAAGVVHIYQFSDDGAGCLTFTKKNTVFGTGDFSGEIAHLTKNRLIVGSGGNSFASGTGWLNLIEANSNTDTYRVITSEVGYATDNIAVSDTDEIFLSFTNSIMTMNVDKITNGFNFERRFILNINSRTDINGIKRVIYRKKY